MFQGLANLYEKTDQWDFKTELPNVYQKLVEFYARYVIEFFSNYNDFVMHRNLLVTIYAHIILNFLIMFVFQL